MVVNNGSVAEKMIEFSDRFKQRVTVIKLFRQKMNKRVE